MFSTIEDKDLQLIKKVPQHPRDRFAQILKDNDKVEFIKQVPLHPRDRLAQKTRDGDNVNLFNTFHNFRKLDSLEK